MWYYGSEYGNISKIANPINLWHKYFTSSKHVLLTREYCGEPDIIEIRKTFNDKNSCILWEEKVLRRLKVLKHDKWLNKTISVNFTGMSEYQKLRISEAKKGVPSKNFNKSKLFIQSCINNLKKINNHKKPKGFNSKNLNHMFGKHHSEQTKQLMRNKKLGTKQSNEHIMKRIESRRNNNKNA